MRFFKKALVMALVLAAIALPGCAKDSETKKPAGERGGLQDLSQAQEVIDNIGRHVILQTYIDLDTKVRELHAASLKLKSQVESNAGDAAATLAALKLAQNAWIEARVPWESTESFLFGPVESLKIDDPMDKWPLDILALRSVLQDHPQISAAQVQGLSSNQQGFHTAEYLLFGDGLETNTRTTIRVEETYYLVAVTEVMSDHTGDLLRAWREHESPEEADSAPFIDVFTLKTPSKAGGFSNRSQALQTIIRDGMWKIAEEVGTGKIATPMGGSLEAANASLVESQFSWNSLMDFQNNVESMIHLYTGDYNGHEGPGIDSLVEQLDSPLALEIRTRLERSKRMIAEIAGPKALPFTRAIRDADARVRAQAAADELLELNGVLSKKLLPLLN